MKKRILTCLLGSLISTSVSAAIITKHSAGTNLSLDASWAGGVGPVPGSADVANWSTGALGGTLTLGADTSWQGLTYSGASAATVITGTNQKLTLGTAGISLSGGQNLTLRYSGNTAANGLSFALAGSQVWDVASGRTLLLQSEASSGTATKTFDLGGFMLDKNGAGALHVFCTVMSNGTVNVNAGELRLAGGSGTNANFTNTLTVNIAPSAKLVVAANTGSSTLFNQVTNLNGGTLDYQGGTAMSLAMVNFGAGTDNAITFGTGTVAGQISTIASLSGSGNFSILDGAGAGTALTLTGLNSDFTGNITISSGQALNLADNAGLKFVIGANGINNNVLGEGSATLAGDFTFDLTGASALPGDAWQIVSNSTLAETYSSTFTVVGFTDNLNNTWTSPDGTYLFSEDTGTLSVVALPEPSLVLFGVIGAYIYYRRRSTAKHHGTE